MSFYNGKNYANAHLDKTIIIILFNQILIYVLSYNKEKFYIRKRINGTG